jgi:hypothetical protein
MARGSSLPFPTSTGQIGGAGVGIKNSVGKFSQYQYPSCCKGSERDFFVPSSTSTTCFIKKCGSEKNQKSELKPHHSQASRGSDEHP